jgi:glycine/D-amino acid oxidase-like deaminating enzyme
LKCAVVGRGLIGSAAARHLARAGHEVVLVGPGEPPTDWADHKGAFASHYDEGRITRINDTRPFFTRVSAASIARYGEIEAESGIAFFTEAGALIAGRPDYMAKVASARSGVPVTFDALDAAALADRFPFFRFPPDFHGDHEPRNAGYLSPRRLVAAQTEAARRHGAQVVDETATSVADGRVSTASDDIPCDQVIVATGGWTDTLLGRAPALRIFARTVALHEIAAPGAARLASMPSLVLDSPEGLYVLPPIRYPDGKLWLKLGGDPVDRDLHGAAEINAWFRSGGDSKAADHLTARLMELMPGLRVESRRIAPCVTSWTDNGEPEIHRLSAGLTIATGGNGAGAKCSDELGRMAAAIATDN